MKRKKFLAIVVIIAVSAASFLFYFNKKEKLSGSAVYRNILIGNSVVKAEVSMTPESREKGLSGRVGLLDGEGMLFIFDKPGFYNFWMKDMNFPIDIIWISENLEIADITENVEPKSFPKTFSASKPARFVLEVNAGWAEKHSVKTGANVKVKP